MRPRHAAPPKESSEFPLPAYTVVTAVTDPANAAFGELVFCPLHFAPPSLFGAVGCLSQLQSAAPLPPAIWAMVLHAASPVPPVMEVAPQAGSTVQHSADRGRHALLLLQSGIVRHALSVLPLDIHHRTSADRDAYLTTTQGYLTQGFDAYPEIQEMALRVVARDATDRESATAHATRLLWATRNAAVAAQAFEVLSPSGYYGAKLISERTTAAVVQALQWMSWDGDHINVGLRALTSAAAQGSARAALAATLLRTFFKRESVMTDMCRLCALRLLRASLDAANKCEHVASVLGTHAATDRDIHDLIDTIRRMLARDESSDVPSTEAQTVLIDYALFLATVLGPGPEQLDLLRIVASQRLNAASCKSLCEFVATTSQPNVFPELFGSVAVRHAISADSAARAPTVTARLISLAIHQIHAPSETAALIDESFVEDALRFFVRHSSQLAESSTMLTVMQLVTLFNELHPRLVRRVLQDFGHANQPSRPALPSPDSFDARPAMTPVDSDEGLNYYYFEQDWGGDGDGD
jgi:hypothetical protein